MVGYQWEWVKMKGNGGEWVGIVGGFSIVIPPGFSLDTPFLKIFLLFVVENIKIYFLKKYIWILMTLILNNTTFLFLLVYG